MTEIEILNRVAELRAGQGHDLAAAAAGAEMLRAEVLAAIAQGDGPAANLAGAAMLTIEEDIGGD